MSGTAANILVGGITNVKVAAYGGVEGGATDVGFTKEGVKLAMPKEYYDVKVDQIVGTIKKRITDRKFIIDLVLSESTLENLAKAFDLPTTAVAGDTLTVDANAAETYRTIYLNGEAESGGTRKVTLHKCVMIGTGEHTYAKDGERAVNVQIEAIVDTLNSNEFGTFVDASSDTTPPTIAMASPLDGGNVVGGASTAVVLQITEAGNMDEGSIVYGSGDGATIMIFDIENPLAIALKAGTIAYNSTTKQVTFTPTAVWAGAGNNFEVIVTTGLQDEAGNHLANVFIGHFVSA